MTPNSRLKMAHKLLALAFSVVVTIWSGTASAACIQGKIEFWWELGNFCDSSQHTCTDYYYSDASQNTWRPLKEVIFEVRTTGGALLASGDVDNQGNFATCYSGTQSEVVLKFYPEHKSGAFKILNSGGGRWVFSCTRPGSGTLNSCRYGSDGSPNAITSVYYSAYAFLKNSSNAMDGVWPYFNDVHVKMDMGASSTWGWDRVVNILNASRAEHGFHTVPHELGHVAHALASRNAYLGPDSSNRGAGIEPTDCGGDTNWTFWDQDECPDRMYVESIADHIGTFAKIGPGASSPCTSTGLRDTECFDVDDFVNLESNVCASSGGPFVRQVMAYFWDTYDDSGQVDKENVDTVLYSYPNGRGDHDKSENWCCTFWSCSPCNHYNTNIHDFAYHVADTMEWNTSSILTAQCL